MSGKNGYLQNKVSFAQRFFPRLLQSVAWYPGFLMLKVFLNMEIKGKEFLNQAKLDSKMEKKPILLLSNHITEFDPIISLVGFNPFSRNFPMFWVSRSGKFYKGKDFRWRRFIYGPVFFALWGAQCAFNGTKDYAISLGKHKWLLEHGYSVCIFPEGTTVPDKKRIRGGAGYLMEAVSPILLGMRISGIENVNAKEFWSRKRKLCVEFVPLPATEEILDANLEPVSRYKNAVADIMSRINKD